MKTAPNDEFRVFLPFAKAEKQKDGSCIVTGYASTEALDLDGERVSKDAIKAALPGYWQWRNIREMHMPRAIGRAQEASVDEKGLFLSAKITDPVAVQKCIDKVLQGFSIGGRKLNKVGDTITELEMVEISAVDRPANPECRFDVAKGAKIKEGCVGTLVKAKTPRDPKDKALAKMAEAVEALSKSGPPAVHDGFSLPAKVGGNQNQLSPKDPDFQANKSADDDPDDKHIHGVVGVTTGPIDKKTKKKAKKLAKREIKEQERQNLASQGKALPGGGFPIKNKGDLANARQAFSRAKDKPATRRLITRRARELGVTLPPSWSKKSATLLLTSAEFAQKVSGLELSPTSSPSFLTLAKGGGPPVPFDLSFNDPVPSLKGRMSLKKGGDKSFSNSLSLSIIGQASPVEALNLTDEDFQGLDTEKVTMTDLAMLNTEGINDPLAKGILDMIKRGAEPSPMARMQMARSRLRKARDARKECAAAVEEAHKLLKSAYLAKEARVALIKAGKKPDDDDADDLDMEKVLGQLQKAYSALSTQKTFHKAADVEIKKAASIVGRSGQTAQEPASGDAGVYEVPPGIKRLSPRDLATASPGGDGNASIPPMYPDDGSVYPGKNAKSQFKKGAMVPAEYVELASRAAAAEAQVEILSKLPATMPRQGRLPVAFDFTKGAGSMNGQSRESVLYKGVNPADLASQDESTFRSASAKVIGNFITSGEFGKSVFESDFHGTAGLGRGN